MVFDWLLTHSKEFALVWFFVVFVAIVIWAFWPGNKRKFEEIGRGILDDEQK
jgi:cbb3-type cytochrome oxidase subunit 3